MDNTKKRFGGRTFTENELNDIKTMVEENPSLTRAALSRLVCKKLNWLQQNGNLKEMRCRVAMLEMEKAGLFFLPPPRTKPPIMRNNKITLTDRTEPQPVRVVTLRQLGEIKLHMVDRKNTSLWNEYIERYHYLGHTRLPGAQMRFIATANDQVIALLGFGAAAWKTASRDNFIGWDAKTREKNLYLIINNARFLILPWIQCKNLASKLLSMSSKKICLEWPQRYGYVPALLETFVEIPRFTGHCYQAANWIKVGRTTGRGRGSQDHRVTLPKKDIWLYPLCKNYQYILCKADVK